LKEHGSAADDYPDRKLGEGFSSLCSEELLAGIDPERIGKDRKDDATKEKREPRSKRHDPRSRTAAADNRFTFGVATIAAPSSSSFLSISIGTCSSSLNAEARTEAKGRSEGSGVTSDGCSTFIGPLERSNFADVPTAVYFFRFRVEVRNPVPA
jgi:hypothetical protein